MKRIAHRVAALAFLLATTQLLAQESESSPEAIRQYRAAVALQNQRLYDLAADEWKTFVAEHDDDVLSGDARHYLGVCYFQLGKFKLAEPQFRTALEKKSAAKLKASSLLNLGLTQFNLGAKNRKSYERATETFQRLDKEFAGSPESKSGQYYAAEALASLGRNDQALRMYQRGLRDSADPRQKERMLYGMAVAQQETKNHQGALKSFDRLLSEFGSGEYAAEAAVRRGDTLLALDRIDEASRVFAKAAENRLSEFADYALLRQAACQFKKKKFSRAGKLYANLIRLHPESRYLNTAVFAVGKSFYLAEDYKTARKWLAKAAGTESKSALEAAHFLALTDIKLGRAEASLDRLQQAIESAKDDPEFLPQLRLDYADALYEVPKRRKEVSKLYAAIADEHPRHSVAPQARYMASFSALASKQFAEASDQAKQFAQKYAGDGLLPEVLAIQAEALLQSNRTKESGETWERIVKDYPNNSDVGSWIVRRAICLNRSKQHEALVEWLKPRMARLRSLRERGEAEYLLGSSYWNLGQRQTATELLNRSLKTSPGGPQSERALLLLSSGGSDANPQAALAAIDQLMERKNVDGGMKAEAALRKAELLFDAKRFDEAAEAYLALLAADELKSTHPAALLGLAWAQVSREDFSAAFDALKRLESEFSDRKENASGDYLRAVAMHQSGNAESAISFAQRYLKTATKPADRANGLYILGLCQAKLGQHQAATTSFEQAIKLSPSNGNNAGQLKYELAWAYESAGKKERAARAFKNLADDDPQGELAAEGYYRNAEFLFAKNELEQARAGFLAAYKAAGKDPKIGERAINKVGWCDFQKENYRRAMESFDRQQSQFPNGELANSARLMKSECAFQQKDYPAALAGFRKALGALSKESTLRPLGMLHAAQSAGKTKDWSAARSFLETMREEYPDSRYRNQMDYELAWTLQNTGAMEKALPLYAEIATRTDQPIGARARFMEGEVLFAQKKYPEAIRKYFKVAYGYGHPDSPKEYHQWQANSLFEAARCCESTKRLQSAKNLYKDLIKHFPDHDKAATARKKLTTLSGK